MMLCMPMATATDTMALRTRRTAPMRRTFFICHHINRPVMPQPTMQTNMTSTATAQIHREFNLRGVSVGGVQSQEEPAVGEGFTGPRGSLPGVP